MTSSAVPQTDDNTTVVDNPPTASAGVADATLGQVPNRPIEYVRPAIIVGVGTSGHHILTKLRRRMVEWSPTGKLDFLPVVEFLCLETNGAELERGATLNEEESREISLSNAEKLFIGAEEIESYKSESENLPWLKPWIAPEALRGDMKSGAQNIRALGRLAFFLHYHEIQERLQGAYRNIQAGKDKLATGYKTYDQSGPLVCVVGSLMGGTCSGCFLDLAYSVQASLTIPRSPELLGIFTIPSKEGTDGILRGNVYAALRELNHYNYRDTEYNALYPGEGAPFVTVKPPFDYVYLVGKSNGTEPLNRDKQEAMIAERLFLEICSNMYEKLHGERSNYNQYFGQPDPAFNPTRIMSFGLSSIRFPRERTQAVLSYKLALQSVEDWNPPPVEIDLQTLKNQIERKLEAHNLDRLLKEGLYRQDGDLYLHKDLEVWVRDMRAELEDMVLKQQWGEIAEHLKVRSAEMHEEYFSGYAPQHEIMKRPEQQLGSLIKAMRLNLNTALGRGRGQILNMARESVNSVGIVQTRSELTIMREFFTRERDKNSGAKKEIENCRAQAESDAALMEELRAEVGRAERSGLFGHRADSCRQRGGKYLDTAFHVDIGAEERYSGCYFQELQAEAYAHAVEYYSRMIDYVVTLESQITQLEAFLRQLKTQLEAKMNNSSRMTTLALGDELWNEQMVDRYYTRYANENVEIEVGRKALKKLSGGYLLGLETLPMEEVIYELADISRVSFKQIQQDDVIEAWMTQNLHKGRDVMGGELKTINAKSKPYLEMASSAPDWPRFPPRTQLNIIGIFEGALAANASPKHREFRDMLQGISDKWKVENNFFTLRNRDEVIFYQEWVAFPLRLLSNIGEWEIVFNDKRSPANPLHNRQDIKQWLEVKNPPSEEFKRAWKSFVRGWAMGVLKPRRNTDQELYFSFEWTLNYVKKPFTSEPVGQPLERDGEERRGDEPEKDPRPDSFEIPPQDVRPVLTSLMKVAPGDEKDRNGQPEKFYHKLDREAARFTQEHSPAQIVQQIQEHRKYLVSQVDKKGRAEYGVIDFYDKYEAMLLRIESEYLPPYVDELHFDASAAQPAVGESVRVRVSPSRLGGEVEDNGKMAYAWSVQPPEMGEIVTAGQTQTIQFIPRRKGEATLKATTTARMDDGRIGEKSATLSLEIRPRLSRVEVQPSGVVQMSVRETVPIVARAFDAQDDEVLDTLVLSTLLPPKSQTIHLADGKMIGLQPGTCKVVVDVEGEETTLEVIVFPANEAVGTGEGTGAVADGNRNGGHPAPPPLPMPSAGWWVMLNGAPPQSMEDAAARTLIQSGQMGGETQVCKMGETAWKRADQVPEFAGLYPPPMPSAGWWVMLNGAPPQSMEDAAARTLIQSGQMGGETQVCKMGETAWKRADQVPELANLFAPATRP